MTDFWQDLRLAARSLRKARGFTTLAVVVVAIGVAAAAAIFSLVDATLIRPLPFPAAGRLTMLWERTPLRPRNRVSPLNFLDWSEQNHSFAAMAAVAGGARTLTGAGGGAERVEGQAVTAAFFDVLGVRPIAGRTFVASDAASRARVVVLGERLWRGRFGSDPTLVGRTLTLDQEPYTVIGIVPARFQIFFTSEMWTLFVPRRSPEQRAEHYMQVIGRLRPGVELARARADMRAVGDDLARAWPDTNKDWNVTVDPLHQAMVSDDLRVTSLVLGGIVAFVLLMACANVANLSLARGIGRTREMAVRAALGGSRGRIVRQLLTESALVASLGGAVGLALAWIAVRVAPALMPEDALPSAISLAFDARVVAFGAAATIVTALLFGLAPAWQAARAPLAETLGAGGRSVTPLLSRVRTALAVAEIAAAVLLVSGAGLLLRSLLKLDRVDPGFHASNVLTLHLTLPFTRYGSEPARRRFYQSIEREVESLPGMTMMAFGGSLPLDGWDIGQGFHVVGTSGPDENHLPAVHYQIVGARYFETLGIPVLEGRPFAESDTAAAEPVCIVNREFARQYLNGRDPLGAFVSVNAMDDRGPTPVVRRVVGVSGQVKVDGPGEKANAIEIYVPITQNAWYSAAVVVRAAGEPLALVPAVKAAIARVDKDQPVTRVRTMEEVAAEAASTPRFRAGVVGVFAAVALALASVGVFGVLAFAVGQRTREFGIRTALGAQPVDVMRLVIGTGLRIAAVGVAIGLAASAALTRLLSTLLFGVTALDPVTFVLAPALLAATAIAACAAPAIRAARVEPSRALRQE